MFGWLTQAWQHFQALVVLQSLQSTRPAARRKALARIRGTESPQVLEAAIGLLEDPDASVSAAAAQAIARAPDSFLPRAKALLSLANDPRRKAAAHALTHIQRPAATHSLIELLGDSALRWRAIGELRKRPGHDVAASLAAALRPPPQERQRAILAARGAAEVLIVVDPVRLVGALLAVLGNPAADPDHWCETDWALEWMEGIRTLRGWSYTHEFIYSIWSLPEPLPDRAVAAAIAALKRYIVALQSGHTMNSRKFVALLELVVLLKAPQGAQVVAAALASAKSHAFSDQLVGQALGYLARHASVEVAWQLARLVDARTINREACACIIQILGQLADPAFIPVLLRWATESSTLAGGIDHPRFDKNKGCEATFVGGALAAIERILRANPARAATDDLEALRTCSPMEASALVMSQSWNDYGEYYVGSEKADLRALRELAEAELARRAKLAT
jgi:hypothetical protein